jgi:hypothetical protein
MSDDNYPPIERKKTPLMWDAEYDAYMQGMQDALFSPGAQASDSVGLRDQFAMAALTGLLAESAATQNLVYEVSRAWQIADAMLAARNKPEAQP